MSKAPSVQHVLGPDPSQALAPWPRPLFLLVTAPDGSGKARTEEVLLLWPGGPGPTRSLSWESAWFAEGPVMEPEVLCPREGLRTPSPQGGGEGWMGYEDSTPGVHRQTKVWGGRGQDRFQRAGEKGG